MMSKIGNQISEALRSFEEDYEKFESGNKAAGTRARKALLEIKKLADSGRKEISDTKEKRKEATKEE
jgi:Histone H1-like protein Hc1